MSQLNPLFMNPFAQPTPPQTPISPLTPQEQESMLSKVSSAGLRGLGWIGGTLSKAFGGRAIRGGLGYLSGHDTPISELLSVIPGSDMMGITDPANEIRGSQLLGGDHNTEFFSPEGIGGLGLDILTDPATYLLLGGSSLTPLGRAASKAGVLPKSYAARLAGFAPGSVEAENAARAISMAGKSGPVSPAALAGVEGRLGGHLGLRIPWTDAGATFDLSPLGSMAGAIPGASWLTEHVSSLADPLVRGGRALFDSRVKGQLDPILQDVVTQGSEKLMQRTAEAIGPVEGWARKLQELTGWQHGADWTQANQAMLQQQVGPLREVLELTMEPGKWQALQAVHPSKALAYQQRLAQIAQQYPAEFPVWQQIANEWRQVGQTELAQTKGLGYGTDTLSDLLGYAPRQGSVYAAKTGIGAPRSITPMTGPGRGELFSGMLGEEANKFSLDPTLRGMPNQLGKPDYIRQNFLHFGPAEEARMNQLFSQSQTTGLTPALEEEFQYLTRVYEQGKQLADYHGDMPTKAIDQLGGFFMNHPVADIERHLVNTVGRHINAEGAYDALAQIGQPFQPGMSRMQGLFGKDSPLKLVRDQEAIQQLEQAWLARNPGGDFQGWVNSSGVTGDQLAGLTKMVAPGQAPAGAAPWLGVLDSILNLTKAGQTAWPATVLRNFVSDVFKRFTGGSNSLIEPLQMAQTLREGQTIPGIANKVARFGGLTDEQATQQLMKEAYQYRLADSMRTQTPNVAGINPGGIAAREMTTVGVPREGLMSQLGERLPGSADLQLLSGESRLNPFNVRGVAGKTESAFAPVGMAQDTSQYLEELNRLATHIDSAIQGYSPLAGAQNVIKAHHDFSQLSGFERDVMRRIIPYFSWLRANAPQTVAEIAQNPGGRMAQTMRIATGAGGRGQYLPETLTNTGLSVPFPGGPDEEGKQRYLTSLGLPFEDLAQLTSLGNMIGSTAPYIRGPAELALGKQFFSGRDVPTSFPFEQGSTVNELAMLSPLSRVFNTARAAGQQDFLGGAMQTMLGPRITQVNQEAARNQAVRESVEGMLSGLPEVSRFQRLYVPQDQLQNLSPDEMMLYRLHQTLEQQRSRLARQRQAGHQ